MFWRWSSVWGSCSLWAQRKVLISDDFVLVFCLGVLQSLGKEEGVDLRCFGVGLPSGVLQSVGKRKVLVSDVLALVFCLGVPLPVVVQAKRTVLACDRFGCCWVFAPKNVLVLVICLGFLQTTGTEDRVDTG